MQTNRKVGASSVGSSAGEHRWNVRIMGSKEHEKNLLTSPKLSRKLGKEPVWRTRVNTSSPWGVSRATCGTTKNHSSVKTGAKVVTPHQSWVVSPRQGTATTSASVISCLEGSTESYNQSKKVDRVEHGTTKEFLEKPSSSGAFVSPTFPSKKCSVRKLSTKSIDTASFVPSKQDPNARPGAVSPPGPSIFLPELRRSATDEDGTISKERTINVLCKRKSIEEKPSKIIDAFGQEKDSSLSPSSLTQPSFTFSLETKEAPNPKTKSIPSFLKRFKPRPELQSRVSDSANADFPAVSSETVVTPKATATQRHLPAELPVPSSPNHVDFHEEGRVLTVKVTLTSDPTENFERTLKCGQELECHTKECPETPGAFTPKGESAASLASCHGFKEKGCVQTPIAHTPRESLLSTVTTSYETPVAFTPKRRSISSVTSTPQTPFPEIVHQMVTETALKEPNAIEWVAGGEAFKVNTSCGELGPILQKYFKHSKYSSLQRQLNMYGWKKCITGAYKGAFHHPNFHRDKGSPTELTQIKRRPPPTPLRSAKKSRTNNKRRARDITPTSKSKKDVSAPQEKQQNTANKRKTPCSDESVQKSQSQPSGRVSVLSSSAQSWLTLTVSSAEASEFSEHVAMAPGRKSSMSRRKEDLSAPQEEHHNAAKKRKTQCSDDASFWSWRGRRVSDCSSSVESCVSPTESPVGTSESLEHGIMTPPSSPLRDTASLAADWSPLIDNCSNISCGEPGLDDAVSSLEFPEFTKKVANQSPTQPPKSLVTPTAYAFSEEVPIKNEDIDNEMLALALPRLTEEAPDQTADPLGNSFVGSAGNVCSGETPVQQEDINGRTFALEHTSFIKEEANHPTAKLAESFLKRQPRGSKTLEALVASAASNDHFCNKDIPYNEEVIDDGMSDLKHPAPPVHQPRGSKDLDVLAASTAYNDRTCSDTASVKKESVDEEHEQYNDNDKLFDERSASVFEGFDTCSTNQLSLSSASSPFLLRSEEAHGPRCCDLSLPPSEVMAIKSHNNSYSGDLACPSTPLSRASNATFTPSPLSKGQAGFRPYFDSPSSESYCGRSLDSHSLLTADLMCDEEMSSVYSRLSSDTSGSSIFRPRSLF